MNPRVLFGSPVGLGGGGMVITRRPRLHWGRRQLGSILATAPAAAAAAAAAAGARALAAATAVELPSRRRHHSEEVVAVLMPGDTVLHWYRMRPALLLLEAIV